VEAMPIHAERNLYKGVKPHLNSFLQSKGGGWEMFHVNFISQLAAYIDEHLPPNYYAADEKSLQITAQLPETGVSIGKPTKTVPDIAIFQISPSASSTRSSPISTPLFSMPVADTFDEEDYITSVVIYHLDAGHVPGLRVTRIEVLSPANKPRGSHHVQYLMKRRETLKAGVRLVEIDLLHETRPIIPGIPSYVDKHEGAYPYWIVVNDPRPSWEMGKTDVYNLEVNALLPTIDLPLDGQDVVTVDFNIPYNLLFERRRVYRIVTDYAALPERFETYSPADQERIRARMAEIAAGQI
jgi:hypothetical protein